MKRYADVISGAAIVLLSIIMLIETKDIRALGIMKFGPKVMPRLVSGALLLVGAGILISAVRSLRAGRGGPKDMPQEIANRRKVLLTAALITFYVFVMPELGFVVSTVLYLFPQFLVLGGSGRRQVMVSGALAVGVSAAVYVLFYGVFKVFLPTGILM